MRQLLLISVFLSSITSYAQRKNRIPPNIAGIAYGDRTKTYKEADEDDIIIPFFSFQWKRLFLRGPRLGFQIYRGIPLINIFLTPHFLNLKPIPGAYSEGLFERKRTVHAGIEANIPTKWFFINLAIERDILNRHESLIPSTSISKNFFIKKLNMILTPSISYQYASQSYSNYYFSVTPTEARVDRPQYNLSRSSHFSLGFRSMVTFQRKYSVGLGLSQRFYSNEIADSPIVENRTITGWFLSFGYLF